MNFLESVRIALNAIFVNKMRSLLTMLGIIIGIASVIAVFAIGNGGEAAINKEFESFGVNRLFLYHNWSEEINSRDLMTLDDLDALRKVLAEDIEGISPSYSETMTLIQKTQKKNDKGVSVDVAGVNEEYNKIQQIKLEAGRFIFKNDMVSSRYVTIIDAQFAKDIFGKTDVLGEKLSLSFYNQKLTFVIIGIQEAPKSSLFSGGNSTPTIYIPYSTLSKMNGLGDLVYQAEINTKKETDKDKLQEDVKNLISQRHHSSPEIYRLYSAESEMAAINTVTGVLTGIISAIAAISLLVGGIGVMNIMLVSVTERTREIGIRKALGARRKDILMQFLVEAIIISLIGGVVGTLIGAGVAMLVASKLSLPPIVPMNAVMIAWLFSAGVGIFFGLYPANQAAKLDPIEALRYE
ncbi:ABC transporter permease [Fusibacter sp. 3D3]|uniref:ABC transporter permease n=1 Tax=Fusibacter sp. 3D3 TaxID=1048380 RepID=UPI000853E6EC|nr:ABC transporter permease [Fusibacter sp. 3D3]GAU76193.1 macrolide export ATP-binding/permease protein MacB [Fusibacter sp. 3D3]